jgi:hypothetical protein
VSTPSVLCTLQWGLAQKDTSFTPGPPLDPEFFFFFFIIQKIALSIQKKKIVVNFDLQSQVVLKTIVEIHCGF